MDRKAPNPAKKSTHEISLIIIKDQACLVLYDYNAPACSSRRTTAL